MYFVKFHGKMCDINEVELKLNRNGKEVENYEDFTNRWKWICWDAHCETL